MTAPVPAHAVDPVDKAEAGLLAKEPTLVAWAAGGAAAVVGGFLFTHYGVDADTTKQVLVPVVGGVVTTVLAVLNRRAVTPAAEFAKRVEAEVQKRLNTGGVGGP